MDTNDDAKHLPLLDLLVQRKDWQGLKKKCLALLATDPENVRLLSYLAIAYSGEGWNGPVEALLQSLLQAGPDIALTHQLVARYWLSKKRPDNAYWHGRKSMELDPLCADAHYITGIVLLKRNRYKLAIEHFAEARSLDVSEPKYAAIELQVRSVVETSLEKRVEHKSKLLELLNQNPDSSEAHELLGDYFADDAQQPRDAIEHYKTALFIDPTNIEIQRKLKRQIPKQNVLSRTLFLPLSVFENLVYRIRHINWQTAILLVFGFKGVLLVLTWLALMLALLGLPAKCYEWFFMGDVTVLSFKSLPVRRTMLMLAKIPFWLRIAIIGCLWGGFWGGILGVFGLTLIQSLLIVAAVFSVHLILVSIAADVRQVELWYAERQLGRSIVQQVALLLKMLIAFNCVICIFLVAALAVEGWPLFSESYGLTWFLVMSVVIAIVVNAYAALKCVRIFSQSSRPGGSTPTPAPNPPLDASCPPIFSRGRF